MNSEQMIDLIMMDEVQNPPSARWLYWALPLSTLIVALVFLTSMPMRTGYLQGLADPVVLAKQLVPLLLALFCLPLLLRQLYPGAIGQVSKWQIFAPASLMAGLALWALYTQPAAGWAASFWGQTHIKCLSTIPILALPLLLVSLIGMRNGASEAPLRSGALAGFVAGGIATVIYAFQCPEDNPLFYVVWYGLAILLTAIIGAIAGRIWLRW